MGVTSAVPQGKGWITKINSNFSALDNLSRNDNWQTNITPINGWTKVNGGFKTFRSSGIEFLWINFHIDSPSGAKIKAQTGVEIARLPTNEGYGRIVSCYAYLQNSQQGNSVNVIYNAESGHHTVTFINTTGYDITCTSADVYILATN